jgi:stage III sporulation protein AB
MIAGGYYKRRIYELERARGLVAQISQCLVYTLATPSELLSQLASQSGEASACDYVAEAGKRVALGESFRTAWRTCVCQSTAPLDGQDRVFLSQVGDILGASDLETQRGQLALLCERLQARLDEARDRAPAVTKLCTTLGTLLGLACAVFLL